MRRLLKSLAVAAVGVGTSALLWACGPTNNAQTLDTDRFNEFADELEDRAKEERFQLLSSHPEFSRGLSATIREVDGTTRSAKKITDMISQLNKGELYTREELSRWYLISDGRVGTDEQRDSIAPLAELLAMSSAEQGNQIINVVREVNPKKTKLTAQTVFHNVVAHLRKLGRKIGNIFRGFFGLLTGQSPVNRSETHKLNIWERKGGTLSLRKDTLTARQLERILNSREGRSIYKVELDQD